MLKKVLITIFLVCCMIVATACSNNSGNGSTGGNTQASNYPNKPIKYVIPYPPGGGSDVLFRLVAKYAEKYLGQTIVPTNMAGSSATVGSRYVKDAKPDGYTILGTHQVVAAAQHTGIVDYGFSAFEPVAQVTSTPHLPLISKTFADKNNIKTLDDFINYVKSNPGKVVWAYTVGSEDHYTIAAMLDKAGIDPRTAMKYVNYPGTGPQYSAVISGQADGMVGDYASGKGYVDEGSMIPLGIVSEKRDPALPDLPTVKEQGIDLTLTVDRGILAPKGTPQEIIDKLDESFEKAINDPEFQSEIKKLASYPAFKASKEYGEHVKSLDSAMAELADKMKFN